MDTPTNYQETEVAGSTWQRAHHVVIENPLGGLPRITFGEQKVYVLGESTITEYAGGQLFVQFDPENPKHLAIYVALNELYTELREARDTASLVLPVLPIVPVEP